MRAGRFDRLIMIPAPDRDARLKILKIHTRDMPLDSSVNLEEIADKTDGFVGADLESLCREAGIVALREDMNASKVTKKHFDSAMGKARPSVDEDTIKFYEMIGKELEGGIGKREIEKVPGETGYV